MLRAGAVAFTLLAGATAAALILAHYSGFNSWPNLLSGSEGTNAGSASLPNRPADGASFLDLGPGSLPFAPGTVTLPFPGVSPAGTGLLIEDSGQGGLGEGIGGNGPNGNGGPESGDTPGGATTGPGEGGPGAPAGPGIPGGGGTPQQPPGGEPPSGGPDPGDPTTPGGGPDEEPAPPPNKPEDDGADDDGCGKGEGQSIAASDFDEGSKSDEAETAGEDFEPEDAKPEPKEFEPEYEPEPEPKEFEPEYVEPEPEHFEPAQEPEVYVPPVIESDEEAVAPSGEDLAVEQDLGA